MFRPAPDAPSQPPPQLVNAALPSGVRYIDEADANA
jgi:hypothetical protein